MPEIRRAFRLNVAESSTFPRQSRARRRIVARNHTLPALILTTPANCGQIVTSQMRFLIVRLSLLVGANTDVTLCRGVHMTRLHRGLSGIAPMADTALSSPVHSDREISPDGRPRRAGSLMRKYEVAALLPDLTVSFTQHVAPASPCSRNAQPRWRVAR